MFRFLIPLALIGVAGCNNGVGSARMDRLEKANDSLTKQVASLRPGLGEYMLSIQLHHNKLWFAGSNGGWELAAFELDEIKEQLEKIPQVCADRPEVKQLGMIYAPMVVVDSAIAHRDTAKFRQAFLLLTNTCNACHQAVHFGFNKIKVPAEPMFGNQDWK